MNDEEIDRLERLVGEAAKCPYYEVCDETKYNQCYDHSHILCGYFGKLYETERFK